MKRWQKIFHTNGDQQRTEVAILISDKTNFKPKTVTRGKIGYNLISGSIHQHDTTIINTYVSSIGASKYIKQILPYIKEK